METNERFSPTSCWDITAIVDSKPGLSGYCNGLHYLSSKIQGKDHVHDSRRPSTKYSHFISLPSTFSTHIVASVVGTIRLHGPPCSIVTDRDPQFLHSF